MEYFENILEMEKINLQKLIDALEEEVKEVPEGKVIVSNSHNRVQYYYRLEDDEKRHYAGKKYFELIKKMLQRAYNFKIITILQIRKRMIEKLICVYKKDTPEKVYASFADEKQKLIEKRILDDDEYGEEWQKKEYSRKPFEEGLVEIYTAKGERVRSKSEKIIADTLERYGIPYRYEYPLEINGRICLYPDFMMLNKRTRKVYFLEHLGMMDNKEYATTAVRRIQTLSKAGLVVGDNLIITMETKETPISISELNRIINKLLL